MRATRATNGKANLEPANLNGASGNPAPTMNAAELLAVLTRLDEAIQLVNSITTANPAGLPKDILEGNLWHVGAPMTDAFREITRNYLHAIGK